eukprot:9385549-Pyramimonas_sp.AAC.1
MLPAARINSNGCAYVAGCQKALLEDHVNWNSPEDPPAVQNPDHPQNYRARTTSMTMKRTRSP